MLHCLCLSQKMSGSHNFWDKYFFLLPASDKPLPAHPSSDTVKQSSVSVNIHNFPSVCLQDIPEIPVRKRHPICSVPFSVSAQAALLPHGDVLPAIAAFPASASRLLPALPWSVPSLHPVSYGCLLFPAPKHPQTLLSFAASVLQADFSVSHAL